MWLLPPQPRLHLLILQLGNTSSCPLVWWPRGVRHTRPSIPGHIPDRHRLISGKTRQITSQDGGQAREAPGGHTAFSCLAHCAVTSAAFLSSSPSKRVPNCPSELAVLVQPVEQLSLASLSLSVAQMSCRDQLGWVRATLRCFLGSPQGSCSSGAM